MARNLSISRSEAELLVDLLDALDHLQAVELNNQIRELFGMALVGQVDPVSEPLDKDANQGLGMSENEIGKTMISLADKKQAYADERESMMAVLDRLAASAQDDVEKRGGLTPYLFSLTPVQRSEFAAGIRADFIDAGFGHMLTPCEARG